MAKLPGLYDERKAPPVITEFLCESGAAHSPDGWHPAIYITITCKDGTVFKGLMLAIDREPEAIGMDIALTAGAARRDLAESIASQTPGQGKTHGKG